MKTDPRRNRTLRTLPTLLSALLCGSCTAPREPLVVSNPDPSVKIPAIKASVSSKDLSSIKQMIKDLESDDPAVRFYSINGLEKLTGQRFGYQYFAPDDKRTLAVEKWKAWLVGWEAAGTPAASGEKQQ